jgi:hypothetical protein
MIERILASRFVRWLDRKTGDQGGLSFALICAALALFLLWSAHTYGADRIAMLRDTSIDAPRCDKEDLMLNPLRFSIAHRGDRVLSWRLFCAYIPPRQADV